jgi:hypothetical protein
MSSAVLNPAGRHLQSAHLHVGLPQRQIFGWASNDARCSDVNKGLRHAGTL